MGRKGPIRATTWRRFLAPPHVPAAARKALRRAVPQLPLKQPFYTSLELQQYQYLNAIAEEIGGTRDPEYTTQRRAWVATQRRAARRYGARRAHKRPRLVTAKPSIWVKVRSHRRRRPR